MRVNLVDNASAKAYFAVVKDNGLSGGYRLLRLIEADFARAVRLHGNGHSLVRLAVTEFGGAMKSFRRKFTADPIHIRSRQAG